MTKRSSVECPAALVSRRLEEHIGRFGCPAALVSRRLEKVVGKQMEGEEYVREHNFLLYVSMRFAQNRQLYYICLRME